MYKGILDTHILLISIYVLLFIIKLYLLAVKKTEALATFRKKTKVVGEMIIPTLFLATGIYLAIQSPYAKEGWFILKMILIVLVVVLGILTFKKMNVLLGIITLLILLYIVGISYS